MVVGLAMLTKQIPDYELFYKLNAASELTFSRIADIKIVGTYYDYFFSQFEAYHAETNSRVRFIANKSNRYLIKKEKTELFSDEENIKILLNLHQEVDYIITGSETIPNFSLLLRSENIMFQIQNYSLTPDEELYTIIQYYE